MPKRFGFWFIAGVCLLSIPLMYFVWSATVNVLSALIAQENSISFDTGIYYYLLITVFWLFLFIESFGKKDIIQRHKNKLSLVIVGWFIATLLLAFFIPRYISHQLEASGYTACADPREISRVTPGKKLIYKRNECQT
jgi:hypothetical protein